MRRKLKVIHSVNKEHNSNHSLKNVIKHRLGLNFTSKDVRYPNGLCIGDKEKIEEKWT